MQNTNLNQKFNSRNNLNNLGNNYRHTAKMGRNGYGFFMSNDLVKAITNGGKIRHYSKGEISIDSGRKTRNQSKVLP